MSYTALVLAISWCTSQLLLCHGFSTHRHVPFARLSTSKIQATRASTPLFAGDGYVPDGLSKEEYDAIKKEEADRLKKMNYSAFGPRFLRSKRPDGDWFLMPTLWTGGFDSNRRVSNNDNDEGQSLFSLIKNFIQQWWPAVFLSYLAIDVGIAMEASLRAAEMRPRKLIVTFVKAFVWAKRQNMWLVWWKAQTVKCALTAILTYPMQKWMDYAETKWSWSRKFTAIVSSTVMIGGSLGWSVLLVILKHFKLIGA